MSTLDHVSPDPLVSLYLNGKPVAATCPAHWEIFAAAARVCGFDKTIYCIISNGGSRGPDLLSYEHRLIPLP